jgi:hypothetical protein
MRSPSLPGPRPPISSLESAATQVRMSSPLIESAARLAVSVNGVAATAGGATGAVAAGAAAGAALCFSVTPSRSPPPQPPINTPAHASGNPIPTTRFLTKLLLKVREIPHARAASEPQKKRGYRITGRT